MKPRLLDLFCCAGGAGMGYARAGFEVVGVDIEPQPRYPFEFHRADALRYPLDGFDVIHASPPCQRYTAAQAIRGNEHPDLVPPTRERLAAWGGAYVIENVVGAPLIDPVEICGAMFSLRTYRHRLFESNVRLEVPEHPQHVTRVAKMGRKVGDGEFMSVVGNFIGADLAREIMGCPWMTRNELREAIPPVYTEYLGLQLRAALMVGRAAA